MKRNLNVYAIAIAIVFGSPIAFANNDTITQHGGTHNGANVIQNHGGGQNSTHTPPPPPVPQHIMNNVHPHGTVNGTLEQTADQNLSAQLNAQQKLVADQKLNAENNATQSAVTKSGNIAQEVNGSAGNNTLKSISEGGNSTLSGTVKGTNEGTFQNDGRQSTSVNAKGGTSLATGNGAGNSTNVSTVTIDKRIEVPVMFNPLPPMINSNGTMETRVTACGPLMQVVKSPIKGTHVGIFSNTYIDLGQDMELAPVYDGNGQQQFYSEQKFANGVTRLFGSQAVITTALPNVSGASTLSIGFAGTNGGGNGGAGSSSAMARIVTKVTIALCELPGAYVVTSEKQVVGLTKEDLKAALDSQLRLEMYTDKVVTKKVPCKMEEFTDAEGKKVTMCRGPKGSYEAKKVTREKAVGTATNAVSVDKK
jgi:hypothetical protein